MPDDKPHDESRADVKAARSSLPGASRGQGRMFLGLWEEIEPLLDRRTGFAAGIRRAFSRRRALGARDRRLQRELLYTAVRHRPWIGAAMRTGADNATTAAAWLAAGSADTSAFRAAWCAGWPEPPRETAGRAAILQSRLQVPFSVRDLFPGWLWEEWPGLEAPGMADLLLSRPPLWLRIRPGREAEVMADAAACVAVLQPCPLVPGAFRVEGGTDPVGWDSFASGCFEVQDAGSQAIAALAAAPRPGERWLDACAGAGGKTLALADAVGPGGCVEALDPRPSALDELRLRAGRAGIRNISTPPRPRPPYDGVLVDAPCSGSGTLRRHPHLKWQTRASDLARLAATQASLLAGHAGAVRPGGRLVYATCSLANTENGAVVRGFLGSHPEFAAAPLPAPWEFDGTGGTLPPAALDSDGYHAAVLVRRS